MQRGVAVLDRRRARRAHRLCEERTWTKRHPAIAPRAVLIELVRQWAFEQVGARDAAVSRVSDELGLARLSLAAPSWSDDPARLDPPHAVVRAVGVEETTFLRATATAGRGCQGNGSDQGFGEVVGSGYLGEHWHTLS